jgi:hypothetical protein
VSAGQRIYRTNDGRHVLEGDPDAAFLAYSQFDDAPKSVLAELTEPASKQAAPAADKQAGAPADKRRSRAADKSA